MSTVTISVKFQWQPLGQVGLDVRERLVFPKVSSRPGLYSFLIERVGERGIYIGETDQLDRRFQHYRTPGPSQRTNIRLNALMSEALKIGAGISVATMSDGAFVTTNNQDRAADLAQKSERVLLEQAAIYVARTAGLNILNV